MVEKYFTLSEIQSDLKQGRISCSVLVNEYLKNIKDRNQELNVFLEVFEEEVQQKAKEIDTKISKGNAGKLAGLVIGIKDILCYKNHKCSAGSKILEGFESQFTATAIQRLIDEDVIIIGRQNCDEFGMGSTNENSAYNACKNASDTQKVAGGSSGGSAVAVQANMCHLSIGSDTGGSVRLPAGYCGVVGFKPSYGRISRWGLIAYASSFDCIGTLAKSSQDTALVLEIMAGSDDNDSTVSGLEVPKYSENLEILTGKKFKIAYYQESLKEGLNPEVEAAFKLKINQLQTQGHEVTAVDFPLIKALLPTYYVLTTAEVSSNLNRFDGIKYGHRSSNATDLISHYKKTRSEALGFEAQKRIMLGTFVLSANYYDAYYTKAQRVRRLLKEHTNQLFNDYDFIISPTSANTAPSLGVKSDNPIAMYLTDLFTVQANVVGCTAIAIPNGKDTKNMPIGFQIMANTFEEEKLLAFANYIEQLPNYEQNH